MEVNSCCIFHYDIEGGKNHLSLGRLVYNVYRRENVFGRAIIVWCYFPKYHLFPWE